MRLCDLEEGGGQRVREEAPRGMQEPSWLAARGGEPTGRAGDL